MENVTFSLLFIHWLDNVLLLHTYNKDKVQYTVQIFGIYVRSCKKIIVHLYAILRYHCYGDDMRLS